MNRSFQPTARWELLELRANLMKRTRAFFDNAGFLEVETPALSADTVVDLHLDPVPVTLADDPAQPDIGRGVWLQTSPEFCMKRILAAHPRPIYQICKAFRLAESGPAHNPEFTIVEWYFPNADDMRGRQLLSQLCEHVLGAPPAEEVTYRAAFQKALGIDPHTATAIELANVAQKESGLRCLKQLDRDGWLDVLLTHCVQPHLGTARPTILFDYPASQAALAKTRKDEDGAEIAARYELFVNGVELANGYDELLDAEELRLRIKSTNALRAAAGKPKLPEVNQLLAAMEAGLPPSTGCALGFDRLVMVAAGADHIAEVIPFPIDLA